MNNNRINKPFSSNRWHLKKNDELSNQVSFKFEKKNHQPKHETKTKQPNEQIHFPLDFEFEFYDIFFFYSFQLKRPQSHISGTGGFMCMFFIYSENARD